MRRRITLLVAATTSVVLLAFLVPAALLVSRVAHANVESRAQAQVQSLTPLVAVGDLDATRVAVDGARAQGYLVWVVLPDGTVLGADPAAGRLDGIGRDTATVTGVDSGGGAPGGTLFAQPVSRDGGTAVIRVLATDAQLGAGVPRVWAVLAGLGLLLFVLSLVVADRLARSLARPVTELAAVAGRLGSGELDARVVPNGPGEVQEVGVALNRLARRTTELLAAERESVADLSHRLRTPITALRLDADALPDPEQRARIGAGVDELTRAVDELIREARRPVSDTMGAECDAAQVVRARLAFWTVLATEQDRVVHAELAQRPLPVRVSAAELGAALDALLGNVFAHTPEGTAITVRCVPHGDGAQVVVLDEGPGLPSSDVLARGRSGAGSTGLGLSIVARTAGAAGGSLAVGRRASGGAEVVLTLPGPTG